MSTETPQYEYKTFYDTRVEIKEADNGGLGSISGYAAIFGNKDLLGDIIIPGAFKRTLPEFLKTGMVLARHGRDSSQPICTIAEAKEDDIGLWYKADFHSTTLAQQERIVAMERLARKKSVTNSIMYIPLPREQGGYEYTQDGRILKDLDLFEITTNAILPVNPKAVLLGAKSLDGGGLPDGLTFKDHSEMVLAALDEYLARARALSELRTKEGKRLSKDTLERMTRIHTAMNSAHGALGGSLDELGALMQLAATSAADPESQTERATVGEKSLFDARKHRARLSEIESWLAGQGISVTK